MHVIKPQALGLSTRPIEYRKRFGLCVSAYLHVPFHQGEKGTLWAEQSMWPFLGQEMAEPVIDEGVAKLTPEYLVHGKAYSTADRANACAVRVRFGSREKTLLVFGERYWSGSRASQPEPFAEMPLNWAGAYGGPDFPYNPNGRGRAVAQGVQWLPNVELPQDRLLRPDQVIAPAGLGALDLMHPQRVQHRGTYDADYLKQHAPGFPPDVDWRYFNMAPPDQWLDTALIGDEAFSFENMHPEKPLLEGRLPGLKARVFAGYKVEGAEPTIREIPLRCTTVWFFPHAERAIVIFQGLAEVGTDDGSDVVSLLGAVERLGEPKSDQHYLDAAVKRSDPKLGGIYALVDRDLLPEGLSTVDPDVEKAKAPFEIVGLQSEAQFRRAQIDVENARQKARDMGKDPDVLGIKPLVREKVPTGDDLPPYLERKLKEAEAQQWAAVEDVLTAMEKAFAISDKEKIDIAKVQHRGPPKFDAVQRLDDMRKLAATSTKPPDLSTLGPKLLQMEEIERDGYRQAAHKQFAALPMPAERAASIRAEMSRVSGSTLRYFSRVDFTGADFSGLDLRDVNFEGAWLESVNFKGANLSGANFSGAVLAHSNLSDAIAVGAKFKKANLGKAVLTGSVLDDADLSEAIFSGASFAGSQMRRARFEKAQLLETRWGEADWTGAELAGQFFYKVNLKGMRWPEANLTACTFVECDLSGVDMRGATLERATFVTCTLDGALLSQAKCAGAVVVKDSTMIKADFSQANLTSFNFGASNMREAKLIGAVMDGANLTGSRLEGADLRLSTAKGALLRRVSLVNANLAGMNLTDAILHGADLRGADFRRSNVFGADLSRVRLNEATSFDAALVTRARTWPRLTPEQQAAP